MGFINKINVNDIVYATPTSIKKVNIDGVVYDIGLDTSNATAIASDIKQGKTAYVNGQKITGSLAPYGPQTITPTTKNQSFGPGVYLNGQITVLGSTALIPENIKSGVNIFGVVGTLVNTSAVAIIDCLACSHQTNKGGATAEANIVYSFSKALSSDAYDATGQHYQSVQQNYSLSTSGSIKLKAGRYKIELDGGYGTVTCNSRPITNGYIANSSSDMVIAYSLSCSGSYQNHNRSLHVVIYKQ